MRKKIDVLISDWKKVPMYKDFPYIADIKIPAATEAHFPYVEFEQDEAESGNYADVCKSHNGGVYIFAKELPEKNLSVEVSLFRG